ncbi:MAG: hypothetical protein IKW08_03790 [Roseburia sp.]|nr:hypothetical protein [Roseburia sp.]
MLLEYFILGALIGAGVVLVAYTVCQCITRSNLPGLIQDALRNSKEEKAKRLLAKAIEARIKSVQGNTVTIEMLEKAGSTSVEVELTGNGVDSSVKQGMKLAV